MKEEKKEINYFQQYFGNLTTELYIDRYCLYCGDNEVHYCPKEIESIDSLNSTEFNNLIATFFDWCSKSDEEVDIINKQHYNDNTKKKRNHLYVTHVLIQHLFGSLYYNKFTQWIDSKSPRQRLISYIFVLGSKSEALKGYHIRVFEKMTEDLILFQIFRREMKTKDNRSYHLPKATVLKVLERIANEKNRKILELIDYQHLFNMIDNDFDYPIELLIKLINLDINMLTTLLVTVIRDQVKTLKIDTQKPIEFYKNLIIQIIKELDLIVWFYEIFGDKFSKFLEGIVIDDTYPTSDRLNILLHTKLFNFKFKNEMATKINSLIFNSSQTSYAFCYTFYKQLDENGFIELEKLFHKDKYYFFLAIPKEMVTNEIRQNYRDSMSSYSNNLDMIKIIILFKILDRAEAMQIFTSQLDLISWNHSFKSDIITILDDLDLLLDYSRLIIGINSQIDGLFNLLQSLTRLWSIFFNTLSKMTKPAIINLVIDMIRKNSKLIVSIYKGSQSYHQALFGNQQVPNALLEGDFENAISLFRSYLKIDLYSASPASKSNLYLVMNRYEDVERDVIFRVGKLYLAVLVNIITDFSEWGQTGLNMMLSNIENYQLITNAIERYYSCSDGQIAVVNKQSIPDQVYKFMEFWLFLNITQQTEDKIYLISKYYNDITKLYENEKPNGLTKLFFIETPLNAKFCKSSDLFKQFYFTLPPIATDRLVNTKLGYLLHLEKHKYLNKNNGNVVRNTQPPMSMIKKIIHHFSYDPIVRNIQLPMLMIKRIIHHFFYDPTIHNLEKVEISKVSKQWFHLCSDILSNNVDERNRSYIPIFRYSKINIEYKYSLWKNYPKSINWETLKSLPWNLIDILLYGHLECLNISLNYNGWFLERDTQLKTLIVTLYSPVEEPLIFDGILNHSPLIESIEFIVHSNWLYLYSTIESILSLQLPNLKDINFYFCYNLRNPIGIHLNNLKNKFEKLPKFNILSVFEYISFSGFNTVGIRTTDVNIPKMIEFYKDSLSTVKDAISFTINTITHIIPLIEFIDQHHPINSLSLILGQIPNIEISIDQIQTIFNRLNEVTNINIFSMCIQLEKSPSPYSILSPNDWKSINLGKFKYPNTIYTKFYQTLK
ncbi:hypothetical protein DLAC_02150 [Tieghemostelium lacteum]|uniref:F-box domain-containing protein n=1 Tax=Tieghemostelium lacteum TaxID=361077 RepID=A0A152A496_TIELA|nr:hypothetical protein DLAC_02150 [Tieghemostelium lacteum]|eukprot:KYR01056.1 hypothetical protein DLAC_02150 [Tieghemostelium lacteum]